MINTSHEPVILTEMNLVCLLLTVYFGKKILNVDRSR